MSIVIYIINFFSVIFFLLSIVAFVRAKEIYVMTHIAIIASIYAIPLLLVGICLQKFSLQLLIKILFLILVNIISVNLICHLVVRRAYINKIMPDAEDKK
jgi:multisubunit Na+/H+ antiporter MnhG subunit